MPVDHHDELPTLDLAELETVTGGADSSSSMMPMMMMMMMNRQSAAAAPPPPPAPPTPKILLNGVEQSGTSSPNGLSFNA